MNNCPFLLQVRAGGLDPFLKNVVAGFNVKAGMMSFASREHYVSNDLIKM
jgi:hypothetical protein